jgi:imidazolonepropionase-like amidohydrolase
MNFIFLVITLVASIGCCARVDAHELWIRDVTVVSAERTHALAGANVKIADGIIAAISRSPLKGRATEAEIIDGRGLYLVPGLIDSHVHLGSIPGMTDEQERLHPDIARAAWDQIPRSYLYFGFTTLIDLISTPERMARWKNHELVPDTYFCGGAALMDGYPMNYSPKPARYEGWPYMIVEAAAESNLPPGVTAAAQTPEAVVTRMKADGAICVKTFFERGFGEARNLPVPKLETARALVSAAHAAGLPVLLHANAADAKIGWQPTIQVLFGEQDLFSTTFLSDPLLARVLPRSLIEWYATKEGQWFHDVLAPAMQAPANADAKVMEALVRTDYAIPIGRVETATGYLAKHRARLLFGTDTPSGPIYANPPGLNGWLEMKRLVDAGVTPRQIFQAATLSNAQALRLDKDMGTVQVGKRANLLLLRQDPTHTVQAYAGIAKVILRGRVIDPNDLIASQISP